MSGARQVLRRAAPRRTLPIYVGNKAVTTSQKLPVYDKYTHEVGFEVSLAGPEHINEALQKASDATQAMQDLPAFKRKEVLLSVADQLTKREEELLHSLCVEAGKPVKDARVEVARAIDTFTVAAEESTRAYGEVLPLEISARNAGFTGLVRRYPAGLISMIAPFNFPINLVAHKVAPAIAAGCPFVLKPNDITPVGALIVGDCLSKTALPEGAFSVLPCRLEHASLLSKDERIKVISFTGSEQVGWSIHSTAGRKKVVLELGGNAACVVDEGSDVDHVAQRITFGAFYYSGQSCISVQRIFAHESLYSKLKEKLVSAAGGLKVGDPMIEDTFLGPLINEQAAKRLESWVTEAVSGGARVLAGGKRNGSFFDATILENVPDKAKLSCEEAFGPICILRPFKDFKEVIRQVNASRFGLQAGVFTRDVGKAFHAFDNLHVGGVVINDIPSVRVDSQPYGGVKASGVGREGLRYAIEDFTEPRVMILKDAAKF